MQREQERGAALGGAATTTAVPSWVPYSAANAPNHQGPLFHRGHPTPHLSPHRLREGPLLTPLHLYANWKGGLPSSRHFTHSTVTRAPCSRHHLTTITIATMSKLSLLLCQECPLILYREALYPVVHRLAHRTPSTRSWPISPSSPSMGFRVVTPTWWWDVPPPFSSLPTFPEPTVRPLPRAAHTLCQRGRRPWYQTSTNLVILPPPRTLPNPPRTRAHTTPSEPQHPPNTLHIRHSAPQSTIRYRQCASRSLRRPVSAPVPSSFFYPPSPTTLPFTPPFVPPYPSYTSLPSPPPAPRAASAGAAGDRGWSDRYRGQLQIQAYQPDKYRSVSRMWGSRVQRSDDRLEEMGRARPRTKSARTESNSSSATEKRKRSLLRLCYFHLRFPHM